VLANHPDIYTTAEPWVMLHPLYALKRQGIQAEYGSGLARRALGEFLGTVPGGEEAYHDALRAMASILYGKALQRAGKRLFLDNTPQYFYILPELVRVFPKARFVLLSRNPAAVLSSLLRTQSGDDLHSFKKHQHYVDLVRGPELLSQGMRDLGDDAVTVHYEDLVSNPADAVKRICEHVGIPFQPSVFEHGRMLAPGGSFDDTSNGGDSGTWQTHLADEKFHDFAVDYIDSLGKSVFDTLGYSSDAIKRTICGEQAADSSVRVERPGPGVGDLSSPDNWLVKNIVPDREVMPEQITGMTVRQCDEATGLNNEGEIAFNEANMDYAEVCFLQAHKVDPANTEVFNNLVVLYWQKGDVSKSLDYLADGMLLNRSDRNLVVNGGQILVELNQIDEAKQLYSNYLLSNPDDPDVAERLSVISSHERLPENNRVLDSHEPGKLIEEGESAFAQGHINRAISLFEEAKALDPANTEICNNLGVAYWGMGDSGKAITCFAEALKQDPDNQYAVINGGKVLVALGRKNEAQALCASYLEQFPDDEEVSGILSLASTDDPASLSTPCEPLTLPQLPTLVQSRDKTSSRTAELITQGEQQFDSGDLDGAETSFRLALHYDAEAVDAYNNLAVVCWQRNDPAAALELLSEGLALDFRHLDLLENTARILCETGHHDDAEIICKQYLAINPDNPDMVELLALSQRTTG